MPYSPNHYNICPCCGTEFGNDDAHLSHEELCLRWISGGARWFSQYMNPPTGWNPYEQLALAGHLVARPLQVNFSEPVFAPGLHMQYEVVAKAV